MNSPCFPALTVAKCSCNGHRYIRGGEKQFTLPRGFLPLAPGGCWPHVANGQMTHSESLQFRLRRPKATWNGQCTSKYWLINHSSSRAAFCVAELSSSMAGQAAVAGYGCGLPVLWVTLLSVRAVCFCLPRLIALIFSPAHFSGMGSHLHRLCLGWSFPHNFQLHGSSKREGVKNTWESSIQIFWNTKFSPPTIYRSQPV